MLGIQIPDHVLVEKVDGKVVVALLRVMRPALYSYCDIRSLLPIYWVRFVSVCTSGLFGHASMAGIRYRMCSLL